MSKKRNIWRGYLWAFILPVLLFYISFAALGIYPFGAKTFFSGDLQGQYVDYFAYLHDMLHGNADWVYTFSKTLGGNMIDMISYYLASPFNIIFIFFDEATMPFAVLLLFTLKVGCMGIAMYWYSKNVAFSTMYAMSGYVVCYIFEFMWMDGVIILPFLIYTLEKFENRKTRIVYSLLLALSIITNYYIGYMICATCGLYFIIYRLLIQEKLLDIKNGLKLWISFAVHSMLGVMLSGFILVPTVYALKGAKMGNNMSIKQFFDFRCLSEPWRAFEQMLPFTYQDGQLNKFIPTLYCGTITLLCCVLFFFSKEKLRKKIGYIIILAGLICSTFFAGINSVWHGFASPTGYPSRYLFIYVFFVLSIGARFWKSVVKEKCNKWIRIALVTLIFIEATANSIFIYRTMPFQEKTEYMNSTKYSQEAENALRELTEDINFYRMIDGSINSGWMKNMPSVNSYTSCEQVDSRNFLNSIGLGSNDCWNSYYAGSTPELLLPLLSIKYDIGGVDEYSLYGKKIYESDRAVIYEKEGVLPIGFFVDESIKNIDLENSSIEILKGVWNAVDMTSKVDIVREIEIPEDFLLQDGNDVLVDLEEGRENLIVYIKLENERRLVNSDKLVAEINRWNPLANIAKAGGEYRLLNTSLDEIEAVKLYAYNYDEMLHRIEVNQSRTDLQAKTTVEKGNLIRTNVINDTGSAQYLLYSLPKESKAWRVSIDGRQLSYEELKEGFGELTMFEVPEGTHEVVLKYVARGTGIGNMMTFFALAMILINIVVEFGVKNERKKTKKNI